MKDASCEPIQREGGSARKLWLCGHDAQRATANELISESEQHIDDHKRWRDAPVLANADAQRWLPRVTLLTPPRLSCSPMIGCGRSREPEFCTFHEGPDEVSLAPSEARDELQAQRTHMRSCTAICKLSPL